MQHPELPEGLNSLIKEMEAVETVKVMCRGCGEERDMNKAYAKYVKGEIMACRLCREREALGRSFGLPSGGSQAGQ